MPTSLLPAGHQAACLGHAQHPAVPVQPFCTLLPYQQDRVLKKTRNIFTLLVIVFSSLHTLLSRSPAMEGEMRAKATSA